MHHQNASHGVEAVPAGPGAAGPPPSVRGEELAELLREWALRAADACRVTPAPRQAFYDLKRARLGARADTLGAAIAAVAQSPTRPAGVLDELAQLFAGWLESLAASPAQSVLRTWSEETTVQAPADVSTALAVHAVETRDIAAIDRAIEDVARHAAALQRLLASLQSARRRVQAERRGPLMRGVPA